MQLDDVVPWGRCLHEYQSMFNLNDDDLSKTILGCGDGPASFNAEVTRLGGKVTSVDPVYQFSRQQIQSRIAAVRPHIMSEIRQHQADYLWRDIADPIALEKARMAAMNLFLSDYDAGKKDARYIPASLPNLPFPTQHADLALCSHYLFLYSEQVNEEQHLSSLLELCRVAHEVRVYPLLALDGKPSQHLEPVSSALKQHGLSVDVQQVRYQFQKGADTMLVIRQP